MIQRKPNRLLAVIASASVMFSALGGVAVEKSWAESEPDSLVPFDWSLSSPDDESMLELREYRGPQTEAGWVYDTATGSASVLSAAGQITMAPLGRASMDDADARPQVAEFRGETTTHVAVERVDGIVQLYSQHNVPGSGRAEYRLELPDGYTLELAPDGLGALILDENGLYVAGVSEPWAIDANKNAIPSYFTWDAGQDVFTQHSDLSNVALDAFPVVADPLLGKNLYKKVTVSGGSKYAINAWVTAWGRINDAPWTFRAHKDEVAKRLGPGKQLYTPTIREQHYCHIYFNIFHWDPDFNMESWRPYVAWERSILQKCNPT